VLDQAVLDLAANRDLVETTSHEYIVGYLCKALAAGMENEAKSAVPRLEALSRVRAAVQRANPQKRDLVRELIEERRTESHSE
jgi:hypothetical protein